MKVALKFVAAVVIGLLAVIIIAGYARFHRELQLFEMDMQKDHRLIGSTLAGCVQRTWRAEGKAGALELVRLVDSERPSVHMRWVSYEEAPDEYRPLTNLDQLEGLSPDSAVHRVVRARLEGDSLVPDPSGEEYLSTYVRVGAGLASGAVEVAESLSSRHQYMRTNLISMAASSFAMLLVSGAICVVAGVWFIGRPLRKLSEKARLVGTGDLGAPLSLQQRDEIGQLAGEMNAMCEQLARAKAQATTETSARIAAMEQLRHADRLATVGKLAAGIAHELGTPLNVVAGRAKMIVRGKVEAEKVVDHAQTIADQADRMTEIIQQLLDFARQRPPRKARIDLRSVAEASVSLLSQIANTRSVRLCTSGDPSACDADRAQIEQVLANLVVNAIQASSKGTTVTVSTGVEAVKTPGPHGGDVAQYAFIRVEDHGQGVTPDVRDRIFEPFFTTKDVGQGAGLGLSVAHGIVVEHGGWIAVQSEPGQGSAFTVYLPAATP